jgi:hypothetical protein
MLVILCLAVTTAASYAVKRQFRRRRRYAIDPLAKAFPRRELRDLDEYLNQVGRQERRRLERNFECYLGGAVGHVVTTYRSPSGIALLLSDGRRLALTGVSHRGQQLLVRGAAAELLKPTQVQRDVLSYRIRLRGHAGADIDIFARNVALAG